MMKLLRQLWADTRGVSAMEFGLILPVLAIACAGTVEFGRMLLLSQKLQSGTFILADLAARDETLSEDQMSDIFLAFNNIIQPFEFADIGTAIVSSVSADDDGNLSVNWQRNGAGTYTVASAIGIAGGVATLPDDLDLVAGETLITAEVFYAFEPIFGLTADSSVIQRSAYAKPRLGTLNTLVP